MIIEEPIFPLEDLNMATTTTTNCYCDFCGNLMVGVSEGICLTGTFKVKFQGATLDACCACGHKIDEFLDKHKIRHHFLCTQYATKNMAGRITIE